MNILERFRNEGIQDEDIIRSFQHSSGGYSKNKDRSYSFNLPSNQTLLAVLRFNEKGKLHKIDLGNNLLSKKAQIEFVQTAKENIFGNHGYSIHHRVLFSHKPLRGLFLWKDKFRIRPCLNLSQVGKGLAWGIEHSNEIEQRYLGPPYPFIIEVKTRKSPNNIIQTDRLLAELDCYQWLLGLLVSGLLEAPPVTHNTPKWVLLMKPTGLEYHLAYEGFNAHESDIENGENFSALNIPDIPRHYQEVDYYNHLWVKDEEVLLPANIEISFELFDKMETKRRNDFTRALYWYNVGKRLYNQEELSIVPFATAIECLLPVATSQPCSLCGKQPGDGPTKLFNEFLKNHLDLPDNIDHLKKSIYPKRSTIVHGTKALQPDNSFFSIFNDSTSELATESFVRRALIKWLHDEGI